MTRSFRGEFTFKVDAKGRVSIPATFRRVLEMGDPNCVDGKRPELVIVYGGEDRRHLEVFSRAGIDAMDEKIAALREGKLKRKMRRIFVKQSQETEVDPDGRLVLPLRLREKIGLENEAYFFGDGDRFQIWRRDTFDQVEAEADEKDLDDEFPDDMDDMEALDLALARQQREGQQE